MAEVARWEASGAARLLAEPRTGSPARRIRDRLILARFALMLRCFYADQRLKGRSPRGWRPSDGFRAGWMHGLVLPGEALPRAGAALRHRVRAVYPAVVHPVRLALHRDGVPYGIDEGLVRFEAGWLCYAGDATAFALGPTDAALLPDAFIEVARSALYETRFRYGNLVTRRAWAFDLAADPSVRVHLHALPVAGTDSLDRPLFDWLVAPPEASGETVLPPLEPMPGYAPPRALARR